MFKSRNSIFFYLSIFIVFGLLLRFINLNFFGIWRDETATLYFSSQLSAVFLGDSHSLFYYLLFKPVSWLNQIDIKNFRLFQGIISFLLYLLIMFRSRKVWDGPQWFFFNALYGLHPLVFGFARLARPYSLLLDLSTLLIVEALIFSKEHKKWPLVLTSLGLTLVHPLGLLTVFSEWIFSKPEDKKSIGRLFALTSLPCLLYYGIKVLLDERATRYIGWIKSSTYVFWSDLNAILLGSYFPFSQWLPLEKANLLMLGLVLWLLYSSFKTRSKEVLRFLCLYSGVFLFFNLLAPLQDLRINRYFVFLFPYFLIALSFSVRLKESLFKGLTVLLALLLVVNATYFHPYFTPADSLGNTIQITRNLAQGQNLKVLACGYKFHNWYFSQLGFKVCDSEEELKELALSSEGFVYLYLDKQLSALLGIMNNRSVLDHQAFPDAQILRISPKVSQ